VAATVEASLTLLDEADRERYLDLAIFPEDVDVPLTVLGLLWPGCRVDALCEELVGLGLVADYRLDLPGPRLVVHDVMRAYLQTRRSPPEHAGAHQRLVDAAATLIPAHDRPPVPWWLLPADAGYLWRYLPYHLHGGGRDEDLAELLGELRWVEAKTARFGSVVAVEADLELVMGRARTEVVNRIHRMLLEILPGRAKRFLTRGQASYLLRTAPAPMGVVAETRHQLARELIDELTAIDAKIRAADKQLRQLVAATGSSLGGLNGIGPSGAARLIGDIGDIARFRAGAHFASWNGTAPIEASSGDQKRHRLSRTGNRRINRVLHIMAVVQLRHDTPGRAYYRRRLAEGKTTMEALRALKRHLSDVVYKRMVADAKRARTGGTGPGGQSGATLQSSAHGPIPTAASSDKSQPGPATAKPRANPRRYPLT
jgi:hypothetical protein